MKSLSSFKNGFTISKKMNLFIKKSNNISQKTTNHVSPVKSEIKFKDISPAKNIDIPKIYERVETPAMQQTPFQFSPVKSK